MAINNVYFFIPNLITFIRFALYLGGFLLHTMGHWQWCAALYTVGFVGDYWDGVAARKLNQSSQTGAVLDMVGDRIATTGLCVILAQIYGNYILDLESKVGYYFSRISFVKRFFVV